MKTDDRGPEKIPWRLFMFSSLQIFQESRLMWFSRQDQTPENGCLASPFLASISLAEGSPFMARAMASFVAS